jgi:predicted aspartyl protease
MSRLNFILDTGTTRTVISPYIADKLKLQGKIYKKVRSGHCKSLMLRLVSLPEVRVGSLRSNSTQALVTDLNFRGIRIDAILGLDLVKQKNFTIDYQTNRIVFDKVINSDFYIHFPRSLHFVMVVMKIDGQKLLLKVDTGLSGLILFENRINCKLNMTKSNNRRYVQHVAGTTSLQRVFLTDASLGGSHWSKLSAHLMETHSEASSGLSGLIGLKELGINRISFDFEHGILSWEM